jgi:hypothetical protein
MSKVIDHQITTRFSGIGPFDRKALRDFLISLEPETSENAVNWRMHDLIHRKVIDQVQLGIFTISNKVSYEPLVTKELSRLSKILTAEFDGLDYCLWNSAWLNDFTRHQLGSSFYIVEVEKDFVEEVFNVYSEQKTFQVYLDPNEEMMSRYVNGEKSLVIKPKISRAPKQKIKYKENSKSKINVPTLEKILIDVYSDKDTFHTLQGSEMNTLFENALKNYRVNFTKLISYAKRRNKEVQIKHYLEKNFGPLMNTISL